MLKHIFPCNILPLFEKSRKFINRFVKGFSLENLHMKKLHFELQIQLFELIVNNLHEIFIYDSTFYFTAAEDFFFKSLLIFYFCLGDYVSIVVLLLDPEVEDSFGVETIEIVFMVFVNELFIICVLSE